MVGKVAQESSPARTSRAGTVPYLHIPSAPGRVRHRAGLSCYPDLHLQCCVSAREDVLHTYNHTRAHEHTRMHRSTSTPTRTHTCTHACTETHTHHLPSSHLSFASPGMLSLFLPLGRARSSVPGCQAASRHAQHTGAARSVSAFSAG